MATVIDFSRHVQAARNIVREPAAYPGSLVDLACKVLAQHDHDFIKCRTCGDAGMIVVRVDGEVTCPDCGYPNSNIRRIEREDRTPCA